MYFCLKLNGYLFSFISVESINIYALFSFLANEISVLFFNAWVLPLPIFTPFTKVPLDELSSNSGVHPALAEKS